MEVKFVKFIKKIYPAYVKVIIFSSNLLTLWHSMLPYVYSYKASCARPGWAVICNFWHLGTLTLSPESLMLSPEHQSAQKSKITNDGLTRSGTECFLAVHIWQQWVSKG